MASALLELRERPFELLLELERRSRIAASGRGQESGQQEEWVGVGFRVGHTPVTDLSAFFGGEPITLGRTTRLLMVNHQDIPAGLLVDEVRGFRRFIASDKSEVMPETLPGMTPFLAGAYGNEEDVWGVLGLHGLVESAVFMQASR